MEELVILKCIKEKGKLRIKVYNNNYLSNINCQFPRDIRKEGAYYSIKGPLGITETRNTIFYRATNKESIRMISLSEIEHQSINKCVVCFDKEKDIIFNPCGHFYCCYNCYLNFKKNECPICRNKIQSILNSNDFDLEE